MADEVLFFSTICCYLFDAKNGKLRAIFKAAVFQFPSILSAPLSIYLRNQTICIIRTDVL
jgi:hypothetical protein